MITDPLAATAAPKTVRPGRATRAERLASVSQRHGALTMLVLAVIAASITFESFATAENLAGIAIQSSFLAVIALGMTFVIIGGGIDLSVGAVFALSGVLAAFGSQWGPVTALLLPLGAGALIGLAHGVLIARTGMAPFIVTLAGLLAARGLMLAITTEGADTPLVPRDSGFLELGRGVILGLGVPVWIAIVLSGLGTVLLHRTRYGQFLFAVGGNEDAASLMGVPVARVKIATYVLSGLLAALAGTLNAARLGSGVTILGVGMELDVIAAVVIGGTLLVGGAGAVGGTVCGVLILGVIQNVVNQIGTLTSSVQSVVSGVFLVVAVVAQTYLSRAGRAR